MNLPTQACRATRLLRFLASQIRRRLPRQRCLTFRPPSDSSLRGIGPIFIINLNRQPERWKEVCGELARILDAGNRPLSERVVRYPACDAHTGAGEPLDGGEISPDYTLGDQLFVEPQPLALPDRFELTRPIRMSPAEIAVARSHIGVWKTVARSDAAYTLVLEDDVWFERGFSRLVDQAWAELEEAGRNGPGFDLLYASYQEARYGAPKEAVSEHVFRPERGLWFLSGYVLSKEGAKALLDLLPCRGPVDLWINHKFPRLMVRALRRSVINQCPNASSTNSYSILPALTGIGVLDCGAALFHQRPAHAPVFAFGAARTGLSSLAMALLMLGYRCCSDLAELPGCESKRLLAGHAGRVFDAYVNIGSLRASVRVLAQRYPRAKFIVVGEMEATSGCDHDGIADALKDADVLRLCAANVGTWTALCEHVRLAPPAAPYPNIPDVCQRRTRSAATELLHHAEKLGRDPSPWIVEPRVDWAGISVAVPLPPSGRAASRVNFEDRLTGLQPERWLPRSDTFPGNLGLFRPANVVAQPGGGLSLVVAREPLGVRDFSAAAFSSCSRFLYGRFEAALRATAVPGLVTGFFLHRDSPRQEIDVEITGNRPTRLLVNVFYNPGGEGAKFDYGYRGTPAAIPLGFDASEAVHRYAIEWDSGEIRWFVDDRLVHRRVEWNPTPIPYLPMALHVNTWPSRSRELAGRMASRALPASTMVRGIAVEASIGNL